MSSIDLHASVRTSILLFLCIGTFDCFSQTKKVFEKDSVLTSTIANDFFTWYIFSAKNGKTAEYNPIEIEDANGMTTLDYSKYIQNLKVHSFSDSLISKEKRSYTGCIQKLSKIKYSDYLKLEDLDDFEALEDDFTNYYRWTGGQEMFNLYRIVKVSYDNENIIVTGCLYDDVGKDKNNCIREIAVTFCKQYDKWKILEIQY